MSGQRYWLRRVDYYRPKARADGDKFNRQQNSKEPSANITYCPKSIPKYNEMPLATARALA